MKFSTLFTDWRLPTRALNLKWTWSRVPDIMTIKIL